MGGLNPQTPPLHTPLESSVLKTCPSHLSLLSLMMGLNFHNPVFFLMSQFSLCRSTRSPAVSVGTYDELLPTQV